MLSVEKRFAAIFSIWNKTASGRGYLVAVAVAVVK